MSNIIKVGSFDVTSIKIGSSDVDKVMVGTVKVYPQETPVTSYKWIATYANGQTASAECDATSAITRNEISGRSGSSSNGLISVKIGQCVTSIGQEAFRGYSSLSSITIPDSVTTIEKRAFMQCSALSSITIPDSVTTIGDEAFESNRLTSLTIPDSVTTIGKNAFVYCDNLRTVEIGTGITSIGDSAFRSCENLVSITIEATTPPTVVTTTFSSTNNCPIYVPCASVDAYKTTSNWTAYASRIQCNQTNMQITYLAASKANVNLNGFTPAATAETFENGLGRIEFAADVTSVGSGFSGKTGVTSIFLPNSVTSIGNSAFTQCKSLSSIDIPSGVTSIGNQAFHTCSAMTSIDIPSGVTSIGENAFQQCYSLTSVTIPSGVTSISRGVFYMCSGLTSINIPSGVTSIGINSFGYCSGFELITIPSGVTSIGRGAFEGCTSLTAITCNPTTPPTLGSAAFNNTNDCPINVPCASVSAYKAATNWSTYESRIQCEGPIDYKTKYFTVVLDESGTITYSANSTTNIVYYSTDNGTNWTALQSRTSTPTITAGKKVLFRATGLSANTSTGIGRFSASTAFSVEGNIMSLVSGDSFANADVIPNNHQFRRLFYNITGLTTAENLVLPAKTWTNACYYQMFSSCSKLIKGPRKMEIPSTMPASGCCQMFTGCTSMTECLMDVGSLSSSTLGNACYYNMFRSCKSLTALTSNPQQIVLPAETLTNQCYYGMFAGCSGLTQSVYIGCNSIPTGGSGLTQMMSGCTNITEIYCSATNVSGSNLCDGAYSPTYMWVKGLSSSANCKFHAHVGEVWSSDVTCQSHNASSYPSGWTFLADIT